MKSLKKYTLDIVPDYLDRFLTARNMSLLFSAGQKELQEFSAYCVFRAITDIYQQAAPQRALYSHLLQQQEAGSGVHDIVSQADYKAAQRIARKGMQNRKAHAEQMGAPLREDDAYNLHTGEARRKGYPILDQQNEELQRMKALNLGDEKKFFALADSKNIGYDAFCSRYDSYTNEWIYTRNIAETPMEQMWTAIDFAAFENKLMIEGIYHLVTYSLRRFLLIADKDAARENAQTVFMGSGLYQGELIYTENLQELGFLPPNGLKDGYCTDQHDVLYRSRLLAASKPLPENQRLICAARAILSHKVKEHIKEDRQFPSQEKMASDLEWFLQEQYPIWDVLVEHKVWPREKVRVMRSVIKCAKEAYEARKQKSNQYK